MTALRAWWRLHDTAHLTSRLTYSLSSLRTMQRLRPFSGRAGDHERHRHCALRQRCCSQAHALAAQPDAQAAKERLRQLIAPVNRGIFGVKAELQKRIEAECATLEQLNTCTAPLEQIESVAGTWRVLYSSIRILGTKRSKLGLREFVKVGDLWQDVDAENSKATNRVEFSISGAQRSTLRGHAAALV